MSIDLEAIEARANAATPGKWKAKTNRHPECSGEAWGWIDGPVENWCWTDRRAHSRADAEFIANAHQDIPALLDLAKQQAAEIAAVTAERDAASVAIFVSKQETNVTPNFSGGLDEFRSIQQINGEWCGRAKNED